MSKDLIHGGAVDAIAATFPEATKPWLDLSTGINPWPYPNIDVSTRALARLPTQADQDACRDAMASALKAPAQSIVLAPGSECLIRLLPSLIHPRRIALLSPTYGDHSETWSRAGAEIIQTDDPLRVSSSVDTVILTHPNNPDGRRFDPEALETARQALAARGGWLIVDEAFADLLPEQSLAPKAGADGLIILRSFGKFFGLAGLRLGACLAPVGLRKALKDRLGAWPVSGAALEIGTRAYADFTWQAQTQTRLVEAAERLDLILHDAGFEQVGGTALFRFVTTKDAYAVFETLARAGIYTRRFAWSQTHLRIGLPGSSEAEARLRAALTPLNGVASLPR
ncbi:MAG: threonine-phosphate decarboxylase CobD [Pseudomonadota bacterium]